MIKLDYTLDTPEERKKLVEQILQENPNPGEKYLEILADYLILCMEKQEKKEKKILTDNRMTTVNKRETSYEGLVSQFENGEDGVYNLVTNSKSIIFQPKVSITKKDLQEIPDLVKIKEAITYWENRLKTAVGKEAFIIKKTIIDLRKDQYIIKDSFRRPIHFSRLTHSKHPITLPGEITVVDGRCVSRGVALTDAAVCSAILRNYSRLKQDSWGNFHDDTYFLMEDFDNIKAKALKDYPIYEKIVTYKIDGLQNSEIQKRIQKECGSSYTAEYISSLWRNKIPSLIASQAEDEYIDWYYLNVEKGKYKRCSRCGEVKLAINKYFSKNKTSRDSFYSICKKCRNRRK